MNHFDLKQMNSMCVNKVGYFYWRPMSLPLISVELNP